MTGYSDNILRFIAERGDSGQLNHVENIDKAYGLRELQVGWWTVECVLSKSQNHKLDHGGSWNAIILLHFVVIDGSEPQCCFDLCKNYKIFKILPS